MPLYQRFNQQRKDSTRKKFLFSLFLIFFLTFLLVNPVKQLFLLISPQQVPNSKPVPAVLKEPSSKPSAQKVSLVETEKKILHTVNGSVKYGETFYSILLDHGFSIPTVARLVKAFKPVFDCQRLSPGDEYQIITDTGGNLVKMTFKTRGVNIYHLTQDGQELVAKKEQIFLDKKVDKVSGIIESSLFDAVANTGEKDQLAIYFADIFAWDIDFRHDLRKGDRFKIIFEKYYQGEKFIRYGKILAAEYINQGKVHRAIYFKDPEGREDYYTPEGISVRRSFLRSPLRFTRISSGYSYRRFHPILKKVMPHLGIDFAAPSGTPVWAVADGVVIYKGWRNGNGNTVTIRHPNGYETMYNHLSRFGKDIKVGKRVKQKEIIGYVGTSGLATGPHLDYRMKKNGKFINPLKEKFPPGFPVNRAYLKTFLEVSQKMAAQLEDRNFPTQKMVAGF